MDMLVQFSGVCARDTVLDVACGPGIVACEFAKHAAHVTGLDLTPTMIKEAGKRQQEQNLTNVSWHIGDVLPIPFPNAYFSWSRWSWNDNWLLPSLTLVTKATFARCSGLTLGKMPWVLGCIARAVRFTSPTRSLSRLDKRLLELVLREGKRLGVMHESWVMQERFWKFKTIVNVETELLISHPAPPLTLSIDQSHGRIFFRKGQVLPC